MNIGLQRIFNQQIGSQAMSSPQELVAHMGAIQAQDATMCRWAVGCRMSGTTNKTIESALNEGNILRTHLMRPTWHLVTAQDIRWILQITAPQVKQAASHGDKRFGLDEALFSRCNKIIEKVLEGSKHLTRSEIVAAFEHEKIMPGVYGIYHVLMRAEQEGIICSGASRGKEATYALLHERVPYTPSYTKDEALATLALRYFTSHAPATLADFIWWSGLKTSDARKGLEMIKQYFIMEKINGSEYFFSTNFTENKTLQAFFLPAFDEFVISYKNRADILDPVFGSRAISSNGIFKPIIVLNGKVIGTWKRSIKKGAIHIEQELFAPIKSSEQLLLEEGKHEYVRFLELN